MTKIHRISTTGINDELYQWFCRDAEEHRRSIGGHLTYLIDAYKKAYEAKVEKKKKGDC